ncbi:MAG: DPP IV N-terminal domain-containing protein [Ferruginibacter sp.]
MQRILRNIWLLIVLLLANICQAQFKSTEVFSPDGTAFYFIKEGLIVKRDLKAGTEANLLTKTQLTPYNGKFLKIASFAFSADQSKILVFVNTQKVWRYNTRGSYRVYDVATDKTTEIGKGKAAQSLMYAKLSPDAQSVAYVSEQNVYAENLATGAITQLTFDGNRKLINGTFDWVYEEEFGCRDGFRWSPDSKQIAFWQVDANGIKDYLMLNTTESNYSKVIPVEYPKVGEAPSPVKIGVVSATGGAITWMKIEGDPQQHYLPRMEWANAEKLIVQQLNRKQQESKLIYCSAKDGQSTVFMTEKNDSWIEVKSYWNDDNPTGWEWVKNNTAFLWVSENDGWRHVYRVSSDGKNETLLTKGNYDVQSIKCIDEKNNFLYFMASPNNATQLYLYRVKMDGKATAELVSSADLAGVHEYLVGPNALYAKHGFSNHQTPPTENWVALPDYIKANQAVNKTATQVVTAKNNIRYIKIPMEDGVTLDAWINYPDNFDSTKKYPVVLYVYGEPAASTVMDSYGTHQNYLYNGDMNADGYFQVSIDNRGTPSLKGAAWRKAIYRKIGSINIKDQAMGMKKILEQPYFDKDRVAVWGWSGGGSSTLHLLFQYPDIFKSGVAIAAVGNQLFYDNIYQERYMGLPQENKADFVNGSPITYAKNLKGKLLYIHGTGDDNVHYSNAEVLINELVKYNKQFQLMSYPNRSHSMQEGQGTGLHLVTMYTNFIRETCPPGAR